MENLKGIELVYKPNDSQIDKRIVNNMESLRDLVEQIGIKNLCYCDISHYTDENGNEQYIRQSFFAWAQLYNTNKLFLSELFEMPEFWQQVKTEFISSEKSYLCSSKIFKKVWDCGIREINKQLHHLAKDFLNTSQWSENYETGYTYMLFCTTHKYMLSREKTGIRDTSKKVRLDFLDHMIEKTK